MKTWRVGIDCRLSGTQHTGIGRYIAQLVPEIINQAPSHYRWVLFVKNQDQKKQLRRFITAKKQPLVTFRLAAINHYSLKEQWQLAQIFNQATLDLLHVPHFNKPLFYFRKTVVTIHDLLWHKQKGAAVTTLPSWLYYLKYLFYRLVVKHAVDSAAAIIVPSQQTKHDLVQFYPQAQSKIHLIYEGIKLQASIKKPQKILPKEFLLYVGSLYPHKNIQVVLKALSLDKQLRLVIVSARSAFRQRLEKQLRANHLTHQVIFFNWVSDAKLRYLYRKAKALVQPSLHEGFGLTGVEALREGTPVIASDIKVFHEIYGPLAYYFKPNDALALLKLMRLSKNKLKQKLKPNVLNQQLARYSWSQAAKATLAVYEKIRSKTKT